jgi:hypothetical protein
MSPSMQQRRSRRRVLGWIPTAIGAVICVGVVVAAILMQNSWWNDPERPPAADQRAPDGMSMLGGPGIDYLTRQGALRVRVGPDALAATELGLEANGSQTFEPLTPVQAIVLAPEGSFHVDVIRSFTVVASEDRVQSVQLVPETDGSWLTALAHVQRMAPYWGWTEAEISGLEADLTLASQAGDGRAYSAEIPPVEHKGAMASAEVSVDVSSSEVTTTFIVSRLDR